MILEKLVPLTQKSSDKSFVFLFDMAVVFEKFVGRLYQEIDSSTELQKKGVFNHLHLKPDIVMDKIIIDTKYKIVQNRGDLSTQDKYQAFVYGINFDIRGMMLLYPKHLYDIDDDLELGKDGNMVNLRLKSLDLDFSGGYNEFIKKIKNRLENLI